MSRGLEQRPRDVQAEILLREEAGPDTVLLTLHAPAVARSARPGQFVQVSCSEFLGRPIGLAGTDPDAGTIQIGIQVRGAGTADIAARTTGTTLSVLGPLGHGFSLDGFTDLIVVAGGTGVFPAWFLLREARRHHIRTWAYCGYRSADRSLLSGPLSEAADHAVLTSDEGDLGYHGTCVQALAEQACTEDGICRIGSDAVLPESTLVAAVGPRPMMRAAAEEARRFGFACQVSLEERMACGIGVCLVCACKTKGENPDDPDTYRRCCADGPVFPAEEIVWD